MYYGLLQIYRKRILVNKGFLSGYEYRFVGIAHLNLQKQPTRSYFSSHSIQGEIAYIGLMLFYEF